MQLVCEQESPPVKQSGGLLFVSLITMYSESISPYLQKVTNSVKLHY